MGEKSKKGKFKRFLKRNMTKTWAMHFSYQVFSFVMSIVLVVGVANYAITKSYDERVLNFVDGFTITAHTGSFGTSENSIESIEAAIENGAQAVEFDIRQRPDGTLVMSHDIVLTNSDGIEVEKAFDYLQYEKINLNLDVKENKTLESLHDLLLKYNLIDRTVLTGITTLEVKYVKEYCSDVDYYLNYIPNRMKIYTEDYQEKLLNTLNDSGAVGINCNYKYASEKLSKVLHKSGYKLSVWTVDKKQAMKRMLVLEPDNITTKKFAVLNDVIDSWKNVNEIK